MSTPYGPCRGEWLANEASKGDTFTCDHCGESVRERDVKELETNGKWRVLCEKCATAIKEDDESN